MKRTIPLILMLAVLLSGCSCRLITAGDAQTIEPKLAMAENSPDPWNSIDAPEEKQPLVELIREPDMDEPPAACSLSEDRKTTPETNGHAEPIRKTTGEETARQSEADPRVEAFVSNAVQEQRRPAEETSQAASKALESRASHTPAPQPEQPSPFDPILKLGFVIEKPEEPKQPQITCAPEPTPAPVLDWPYPQITCPPEPTPTPVLDWPHPSITCPPEPSPAPEPTAPTQAPVVQPSAAPVLPDAPAAPAPEQPTAPEPTPAPEPAVTPKPSGGYAVCSCGAKLMPDELVAHMKAHALNGESHSYVAY